MSNNFQKTHLEKMRANKEKRDLLEENKKIRERRYILDKDIKLNISNKNIEGVLDLKNFSNLEELDCSNNKITEIINIPKTLKYLNCENNKITKLNALPDNLTGINCKKNPLKELYYPFNIKPKKYPSKLTHLKFGNKFNQTINNLPNSITHLTLGDNFNQSIDDLPDSIKYLNIGYKCLKDCNKEMCSIIYLLKNNSNGKISKLPNQIEKIEYGYEYEVDCSGLVELFCRCEFYNDDLVKKCKCDIVFNNDSIIIDNLLDFLNLNYEKKSEINLTINYYTSNIMTGIEFLMDEVLEKLKINEDDVDEYENWINLFDEHEKLVIEYYKKKYKNIKNIKCIYCVDD